MQRVFLKGKSAAYFRTNLGHLSLIQHKQHRQQREQHNDSRQKQTLQTTTSHDVDNTNDNHAHIMSTAIYNLFTTATATRLKLRNSNQLKSNCSYFLEREAAEPLAKVALVSRAPTAIQ
ncbi:unnamed protein product, partial [Ectocarpus fasciculatus]